MWTIGTTGLIPTMNLTRWREELGTTDLSFSPAIIFNSQFDFQPLQNLHLNLGSRYVGKQYIDNTSSEERILDPYFINDLRISYAFYPQFMDEIPFSYRCQICLMCSMRPMPGFTGITTKVRRVFYDGFFPQAGRI